jgi:hypothetical protein
VADALDRDALLRVVDGLAADAILHELTALKSPPRRHAGMVPTDRLREDVREGDERGRGQRDAGPPRPAPGGPVFHGGHPLGGRVRTIRCGTATGCGVEPW